MHLLLALPCLMLAEAVFFDFRANYRDFEGWHMRQRAALLQDKYDRTQTQLLLELKDESPPLVDTLTMHHTHKIVAADPSSGEVTLDQAPDCKGASHWALEGCPVQVGSLSDTRCFC